MDEYPFELGEQVLIYRNNKDRDDEILYYGIVVGYSDGQYLVRITELGDDGTETTEVFSRTPDDIFVDAAPTIEEETPKFGMSASEFKAHVEYLMGKTLSRVTTTGTEQVFYGFQEFEGKTPGEILPLVLRHIEDSITVLSQAHILVSRNAVALRETSAP